MRRNKNPRAARPAWWYDEFQQIGADYTSKKEIEIYDKRMARLRDVTEEAENVMHEIRLKPAHVILEMGCGTGEFALAVAPRCRRVLAVDISKPMLDHAKAKAHARKIKNIEFAQAGFLTHEQPAKSLDAVVTSLALHHLPGFWKAVALKRLQAWLKPKGCLFLRDVVFSFLPSEVDARMRQWLKHADARTGSGMIKHLHQEYSEETWVMEGMLQAAGFRIRRKYTGMNGFIAEYTCVRV